MHFNTFKTRLRILEEKSNLSDCVLVFPDGSARAIRVRDPLGVFCASMDRVSWDIGSPEGYEDHGQRRVRPMPESPHDALIDLIGSAIEVRSDDIFLKGVVHQLAVEAKKAKEDIGQ